MAGPEGATPRAFLKGPSTDVTLGIKSLGMESHLPQPLVDAVAELVNQIDDFLQHDAHEVEVAMGAHAAFDRRDVDSLLVRSLISDGATRFAGPGLVVEQFGLGGCEVRRATDGVLYRFRFKRARLDQYGAMVVKVNADSAISHQLPELTLWDDEATAAATDVQDWMIAYLLHPETRTFTKVILGKPVDFIGKSPLKVVFGATLPVPLGSPTPERFVGDADDLDLGDEDLGSGEERA